MALKRELGFLDVFAMAAGAMISSGLFVLPAIAFAQVGSGVFLCYALAAVLLVPSVLTKAELMTAMPKAGGTYFFIDRGMGPGFGAMGGVAAWSSLAFKSAFALLGLGAMGAFLWGWDMAAWQVKAMACAFCLLFTVINLAGVKHAGRVQIVLVAALLCVLLGYVVGGVGSVEVGRYRELFPQGWNSLLIGTGMVFVAFGGVTKVATLAEEVRNPKRNLLSGMFVACGLVAIVYVAAVFVTVGLLPPSAADWSPAPLSQAAGQLWGNAGVLVLGLAAVCAFLTTGNAGILAASRTIMAMSQDRLLPRLLGLVSPRRGTPVCAILLTSGFMALVILLLDLEMFVKAASTMKILLFTFEMVALILMRESRIPTYAPSWRCPLYPWLQIAGILCYGFLLVELGTVPLAIAAVILGGALLWYAFYAKVRVLRESALIRVAARVAKADFGDHDLEAELSRLARQAETVLEDRFDRLIKDCTVLDLTEPVSRDEAFRLIAGDLAPKVGRTSEEVYELLIKREQLSATVVRAGLAIPHLILEGLDSFQVLLVRSRAGIAFAEGEPPVHAMFVLAASPQERNFYLKALMAIAEIAQEPDFDGKWMAASSGEAVREVVLAAERRREHLPPEP